MSMAAKLSDLVNRMSGPDLQTEGQADVPSLPLAILVPGQEAAVQLP